MSRQVLFTGDLHLHTFADSAFRAANYKNSRLAATLEVLNQMLLFCKENNAAFFFVGDWFHSRVNVPVEAIQESIDMLKRYPKVEKHFIPGNHDYRFNTPGSPCSLSIFEKYGEVYYEPAVVKIKDFGTVFTLPWLTETEHLLRQAERHRDTARKTKGVKVLVAHLGLTGALVGPDDFAMTGNINLGQLFPDQYNYVLLSHFHKHQNCGKGVYYIGSPIPTSFGEVTESKVFAVGTKTVRFVKTDHPKLVEVSAETLDALKAETHGLPMGSVIKLYSKSLTLQDLSSLRRVYFIKLSRPLTVKTASKDQISTELHMHEMINSYVRRVELPDGMDRKKLAAVGRYFINKAMESMR